jgi:hypothetical protein
MTNLKVFVIFSVFLMISLVKTDSSYPTISPVNLKKNFDSLKPYSDLSNAFYSVRGLNLLGETLSAQSQTVNLF